MNVQLQLGIWEKYSAAEEPEFINLLNQSLMKESTSDVRICQESTENKRGAAIVPLYMSQNAAMSWIQGMFLSILRGCMYRKYKEKAIWMTKAYPYRLNNECEE